MARLHRSVMMSVVVTTALVGAVPVAVLAVTTAWLLSNRSDIEPRPRPAVLQLPAPTLADERNAFFALTGLSAEAGRDPAAVGRALWQVNLARAALLPQKRLETTKIAELNRQEAAATGVRLPTVSGAPLYCKDATAGCVAEWLAEPVALAEQRALMAVSGARCDSLFMPGQDTGFEERLPQPLHPAAHLAPHVPGAVQCGLWWRSGAVLALQQGRPQQARALLQRATDMNLRLQAGGLSLISNVVTASIIRDTQSTVVALGLRDPDWAATSAPLLASVSDEALVAAARRWMAVESAVGRRALAEVFDCPGPAASEPDPLLDRVVARLGDWQCRHRIGFQKERTLALADDFWAGAAHALGGGVPAGVNHLETRQQQAESAGLQWRNTVGHILIDVAMPAYKQYLRQTADLPLHTEAAALALAAAAQRVPAAERAAWAQRQPLSADLRERLQWDAFGQGFTVRTWYQNGQIPPIEPRKTIRFAWPNPPQG